MGSKIIKADQEDIKAIQDEESTFFVFETLVNCGISEEELAPCLPVDGPLTVEQKIHLRNVCLVRNLVISNDLEGGVKIYSSDHLIAEWKKPTFVLRVDRNTIDRTKRMHVEIHCSWWSRFEEQENE